MLMLEIPRAEEIKPKRIKVKAKTDPKKIEAKETKEAKS